MVYAIAIVLVIWFGLAILASAGYSVLRLVEKKQMQRLYRRDRVL